MQVDKTEKNGLAAYRARVAAEKKNTLLESAIKLFLAKGYDLTTLEDVARDAGVSSATLYKHFPTKADLFGGIMQRIWSHEETVRALSIEEDDPYKGLIYIGTNYADLLSSDQIVALFRVIIAEMPRFPELGLELYERGKKPYLDGLETYLKQEVKRGRLEISDVVLAARQLLGMINDLVFWPRLLVAEAGLSKTENKRVVEEAVRTFLKRYQR
ncbi:MAG: TetR/AcrR family transcriptional regulator [Sneathiella sp.]